MAQRPDEDTEPRVQQLFIGPYRETGMGSQDLAGAGLCVSRHNKLMPQDVKIWEINKSELKEVSKSKLDSEKKLEEWIEKDISIISNDLLVLGRQVHTAFGDKIDLLCIDRDGNLIIVELKRDKTPREIIAQTLDYASWVKDLSSEDIMNIADDYFKEQGSLEKAFEDKFELELPDSVNAHHRMLIVGSEIDESSERIIKYLSDNYGVDINAITFQYSKHNGKEYLSRVFLIEQSEVEYRNRQNARSKRNPNLTYEQLKEIAQNNGVGNLFDKLGENWQRYFDYRSTTMSTVAFRGHQREEKSKITTIFSISPEDSSSEKGLWFKVRIHEFADYFGLKTEELKNILPSYKVTMKGKGEEKGRERGEGYFKNEKEADEFLRKLGEIKR